MATASAIEIAAAAQRKKDALGKELRGLLLAGDPQMEAVRYPYAVKQDRAACKLVEQEAQTDLPES